MGYSLCFSPKLQRRKQKKTSGSQKRSCRGLRHAEGDRELERKESSIYDRWRRQRETMSASDYGSVRHLTGYGDFDSQLTSVGMVVILLYVRVPGNNWVSLLATEAVSHEAFIESPASAQGHNHTLQITHRAVRPRESLHLQWTVSPPTLPASVQPPCCCFSNLPQLWLGSIWTMAVHFLTLSRPRWLDLPAGWVALLPRSHLHAKCVFICFPVLVLWKRKQLNFYNWVHGPITQLPQMRLGI